MTNPTAQNVSVNSFPNVAQLVPNPSPVKEVLETPNSLLSKSWPGITNALFVRCAMDPWWAKDLSKMKETLFVRNARARKCWKKWRRKAKKLTKLSGLGKYTLIKKPNFLGLWKTLLKILRPKKCKYVKETFV